MAADPQITPKAWRWAMGWSIAILLLSCVPYLIATLLAPEGWQFAGILVNPYDGHSYMAKMRQGLEGNWLFHLTYTPEPHDGAFIFIFYLALGHLAALTHLPLILIFHLARLVAGLILLLTLFRFVTLVTPHPREQRLAFVLLFSASGLGWLGAIFGAFPIDLWVPEAFVPYSLYANPHFPLAMALMLIILQRVAWPTRSRHKKLEVRTPSNSLLPTSYPLLPWTGLAALALALILPFALLTVWTILAVYLTWLYVTHRRLPWPQIWPTLGVVVFSAPIILYDYWVSTSNPILAGWGAQNVTPAPPVSDLVLGYGLVGLLAIVGIWIIVYQRLNPVSAEWLVLLWAATTVVLVYLPFDLQRRLINGLHIPLCLLAAIGLSRWLSHSRFKLSHRRLITNSVVTIGALGTLIVWSFPLLGMLTPPTESETTALFFWQEEEIEALNWLRDNTNSDDVVLASPRVGMFVPGQTGARAFYGHPFETIEAEDKKEEVEAFYRGEIETAPLPVDFIIYGPSEQAIGQPKNVTEYPVVFSTKNVLVYKAK
jgi:uncharacterized membrane protein